MKEFNYHGVKIQIPEKNYTFQKNVPTYDRLSNGSYEKEEIILMEKIINEDSIVLDLGASIGVLSCVINNLMVDKSKMVSVEANPDLYDTLENNRDINNLEFSIFNGAGSSTNKEVEFNFNGLSLSGSLMRKDWLESDEWGEYKSIKMETVTPIDLEEKYNMKFNTLSCDIEGEEHTLLSDLFDYFSEYKYLVVEFHQWAEKDITMKDIENLYSEKFNIDRSGSTILFSNKKLII